MSSIIVIRNNSDAFKHWAENIKGYHICLLGHCVGVVLPDDTDRATFDAEWEEYQRENNPSYRPKGGKPGPFI